MAKPTMLHLRRVLGIWVTPGRRTEHSYLTANKCSFSGQFDYAWIRVRPHETGAEIRVTYPGHSDTKLRFVVPLRSVCKQLEAIAEGKV